MSREPIYVEIRIRCGMDDLWRLTQTPELHRRWDLRFTDIEYLPRPDEAEPLIWRALAINEASYGKDHPAVVALPPQSEGE